MGGTYIQIIGSGDEQIANRFIRQNRECHKFNSSAMKRIVFYCILMNLISYACSNEATSYWSQGGPSAQDGWDIFTGSGYRYGPSIIINDDGSIDAWFAAPGDYHHGESAITYGDAAKEAQQ